MLQPARPAWAWFHGLEYFSGAPWLASPKGFATSGVAMTGRQSARQAPLPEVIVHDPGAERPHDLDDPFLDPKVQSRIAGVIADNAAKKN